MNCKDCGYQDKCKDYCSATVAKEREDVWAEFKKIIYPNLHFVTNNISGVRNLIENTIEEVESRCENESL